MERKRRVEATLDRAQKESEEAMKRADQVDDVDDWIVKCAKSAGDQFVFDWDKFCRVTLWLIYSGHRRQVGG